MTIGIHINGRSQWLTDETAKRYGLRNGDRIEPGPRLQEIVRHDIAVLRARHEAADREYRRQA